MKRTTLVLEDGVFRRLRREAQRAGRQMSELANALLAEGLARRQRKPEDNFQLRCFSNGPAKGECRGQGRTGSRDGVLVAGVAGVAGVIDTNILLYAVNREAPEHLAALEFLTDAGQSPDQWYLTEGMYYEFLRVATHPRVFPSPLGWQDAMAFLAPIYSSDRFATLTAGTTHWKVLNELLSELTHPAGTLFFDIRTVTLMREHGVRRIYTADTDFLQFQGVEVTNPVR